MKRRLLLAGGILLALGVLGFLVAASGIISTQASSGHWKITEKLLHFSMQRSAATYSLGLKVPRLDDEGLILQGALHYEFACRSCHGAPGVAPSLVTQKMLPPPADLVIAVPKSDAKKLFHVVKHGVKFTGMPAFPSQQRDDEVWAVVAFLLRLPALDAIAYRRLIDGVPATTVPAPLHDTDAFARVNRSCQQCHGTDGLGRGGHSPRLAGQRPAYLLNALEAYRSSQRQSGTMQPIAAALDDATIRQLANHYAELPAKTATPIPLPPATTELIAQGRRLAHEGLPSRRIPACIECHEPFGRRSNPAYPALAGQPVPYLVRQLELFHAGTRGGGSSAHLMQPIAARLQPEEMQALAHYFAAQEATVTHP